MKVESQARKEIGAIIYQNLFELQKLGATLPDLNDPGEKQALMENADQLANSIAEIIEKQGTPAGQ